MLWTTGIVSYRDRWDLFTESPLNLTISFASFLIKQRQFYCEYLHKSKSKSLYIRNPLFFEEYKKQVYNGETLTYLQQGFEMREDGESNLE